jgi:hypothetical protein
MKQQIEWSEWERQAKAYYRQLGWEERVIETLDWGVYRETYYDGGYTPEDAIDEDLSYG